MGQPITAHYQLTSAALWQLMMGELGLLQLCATLRWAGAACAGQVGCSCAPRSDGRVLRARLALFHMRGRHLCHSGGLQLPCLHAPHALHLRRLPLLIFLFWL